MYARKVDGKPHSFGVSGKLWRDALVMYDRETRSLWSQVDGRSFRGALEGKTLEHVPSTQTTWGKWKQLHPDTLVLKKEEEFNNSHYEDYFSDPEQLGVFGTRLEDRRLGGKELVVGFNKENRQIAFPVRTLRLARFLNWKLEGENLLLFADKESGQVLAYSRNGPWGEVTFRKLVRKKGKRLLKDRETESLWDPLSGEAIKGELRGERLEKLPVTETYWFAWTAFFPKTELWNPGGSGRSDPSGLSYPR